MTIHRRSDTSGFALLTRHRLSVVLVAVVLAAGCGGSASQRAAPVGPASIAQSPAMGETAGTTSAAPAVPTVVPSDEPELLVVAAGDSIPFDDSGNGFVNCYAAALGTATGKTVGVRNLSQHTGLQVQDLLDELGDGPVIGRAKTLSEADAIIVGIAHNDVPWNLDDDACDGADNEGTGRSTPPRASPPRSSGSRPSTRRCSSVSPSFEPGSPPCCERSTATTTGSAGPATRKPLSLRGSLRRRRSSLRGTK